ncbi:MAG: MAP7 domain-containing protein [Solirubrobacterales bacterium]
MIAGLVSAAGAAVLALGSLTAGAVAAPNQGPEADGPQGANIPYVAWVGEHVRLVACDPLIDTSDEAGQSVNYQLEDWSGRPEAAQLPAPDPGSSAFFAPSPESSQASIDAGCVKIDYKGLNPGLARIRAVVTNEETGAIVYSHQFLVIWLTTNKPTMAEVGTESNVPSGDNTFQSQLSPTGHSNLANFLGDPSGNGEFVPSPFEPSTAPNQDKGLVQIKVTGSFPVELGSSLHNILPEASYTLPESWATLAKTLATSSEEKEPQGSDPSLWDIHGTPSEGTTPNAPEPGNNPLSADYLRLAFSNYTSGKTATVGPFDPEAANATLLSDERLNADDAPMPALRVDVSIAGNEGGSSLGGVGQISGASKALIYSHNFDGNAEAGGNLYNPYYGSYIPSTDRGVPEASGIDGPSPGGDFPAFLNKHPEPYTFWTSVSSKENRSPSSTGCLRRTDADPSNYQTPGGPLTETFYTDERGEAYVTYTPGDGFYLNHLPVLSKAGEEEAGKIIKNADGGCDLKNLFKEVIGESSISATAVYPYQSVDYSQQTSETPVVKKVRSMWEKEFFEFPKGPGPNEQNVRILVAKAQDIDGRPIVHETVCFHAQQEAGVYAFSQMLEDPEGLLGMGSEVDLSGSWVRDPADAGSSRLCETTNSLGLAAVELVNSTSSSVDLTVRYENEGIIRDHLVDFSTNIGAKEKKAAEEKAAAEKKAAEEAAAAEKKAAEEKAVAEREAAEKKQHEREIASEKARQEREEAAEKRQHEKEAAKEVAEKKTAEEIEANNKIRAEEEAATKKRNEEELAKRKGEIEALSKLLGPQVPGALADPPKGHGKAKGKKAHLATKHKRSKKHKK